MITIVEPTNEKNGIIAKKVNGNINSCELRKVSINGRDNGYIGSVNKGGLITNFNGSSWRGKAVKSPVENLEDVVNTKMEEIKTLIG